MHTSSRTYLTLTRPPPSLTHALSVVTLVGTLLSQTGYPNEPRDTFFFFAGAAAIPGSPEYSGGVRDHVYTLYKCEPLDSRNTSEFRVSRAKDGVRDPSAVGNLRGSAYGECGLSTPTIRCIKKTKRCV